tara:strand:+ start:144 stop:245 length:102 start_codon:yes stop_codon:yes gene_type:complete
MFHLNFAGAQGIQNMLRQMGGMEKLQKQMGGMQ